MESTLVTVVIALYNPNSAWLRLQLNSLNEQTFNDFEIIAMDDCSSDNAFYKIESIFADCIDRFQYKLLRCERNLGSNNIFEQLTDLANGEFIAYCDQDDCWSRDKLAVLYENITVSGAALCYSDFEIIDDKSNVISKSAEAYYKRRTPIHGENVAAALLTRNTILGCTSIVRSQFAKKAIPFVKYMVHDHWLALFSAISGKICYVPQVLTSYRIHGSNQTGLLKGIYNREDYIRIRVLEEQQKFYELKDRLAGNQEIEGHIENLLEWVNARLRYHNGDMRAIFKIVKFMRYNFSLSIFDILVMKMPDRLFSYVLKLIRERKI